MDTQPENIMPSKKYSWKVIVYEEFEETQLNATR